MALSNIFKKAAITITGYIYGFDGMLKTGAQTGSDEISRKMRLHWFPGKLHVWEATRRWRSRWRAFGPGARKKKPRRVPLTTAFLICAGAALAVLFVY